MPPRIESHRRISSSEAVNVARRLLEAGQSAALTQHLAALADTDSDPELTLIRAEACIYSGDTHKTIALTNNLLASGNSLSAALRARGLLLRASAVRLRGFLEQAIEDATAAIELLDPLDCDPKTLVQAHKQLGIPLAMQGDLGGAMSHFEAALRLCSRISDLNLQAEIHVSLGITYARVGRSSEAAAHYQNALAAYEKVGRRAELATLHSNIGRLHHDLGEYQMALLAHEKSLQIARDFRYVRTESMALVNIGDTRREMGEPIAALVAYREALDAAVTAQEPRVTCCANIGIGITYRIAGEFEKARFHLEQAAYEADRLRLAWELAVAKLEAGILALAADRPGDAARLLQFSVSAFEKQGATREVVRASLYLGDAYRRIGQHRELKSLLRRINVTVREVTVDWHLARDVGAANEFVAYALKLDSHERWLAPLRAAVELRHRNASTGPRSPRGRADPAAGSPHIEVRTFGGFTMRLDGDNTGTRSWEGRKAPELFVLLLCHPDGRTCEELLEILWPGDSPVPNRRAIHNNIYRIRQAVYRTCVVLDNGRYRVDPRGDFWFDLEQFQRKSKAASTEISSIERKASLLVEADQLYRGEFLAESYSDWVIDVRRNAEAQHLSNLLALSAIHEQIGNHAEALGALDRLLVVDPGNALAHERAIAIERLRGNSGEAHRRFDIYEHRSEIRSEHARSG